MPRQLMLGVACAVAVCAWSMATPAVAQTLDRQTFFTFSGPVAVPGVTLPAGKYLFHIVDPTTSSRVVQVLSADGRKAYAMFFAISAERLDPADEPEVRFFETSAGVPATIKTWWYPGDRIGREFIYPREQARRLARGGTEPVLTTAAETTTPEQTKTEELARLAPGGETVLAPEAVPAEPMGKAQAGEVPPFAMPITPMYPGRALPQTASELPLIGLIGVLALGAGATLRRWRARG